MHENISQLEISMHNLVLNNSLKSIDDLYKKLNSLFLRNRLILLQVLLKVPLVTILQDKIEVIGSFFDVVQFDDIFIITRPQHLDLILKKL